jgi:hypothetical protein
VRGRVRHASEKRADRLSAVTLFTLEQSSLYVPGEADLHL